VPLVYAIAPILPLRQRTAGGRARNVPSEHAIHRDVGPLRAEATSSAAVGPGQPTHSHHSGAGMFSGQSAVWLPSAQRSSFSASSPVRSLYPHGDLWNVRQADEPEVAVGILLNPYEIDRRLCPSTSQLSFSKSCATHVSQLGDAGWAGRRRSAVGGSRCRLQFDYAGDPRPPTPPEAGHRHNAAVDTVSRRSHLLPARAATG
jgi:hypothetical protein